MDFAIAIAAAAVAASLLPLLELWRRYRREDQRQPEIMLPELAEGDTLRLIVEFVSPSGERVSRELTLDSTEAARAAIATMWRDPASATVTFDSASETITFDETSVRTGDPPRNE